MNATPYIAAFVGMVAVDYIYAKYTYAVTEHKPIIAGGWAAAIMLCNSIVVLSYVDNWLTIFCAAAGAFVGTFVSTRRCPKS